MRTRSGSIRKRESTSAQPTSASTEKRAVTDLDSALRSRESGRSLGSRRRTDNVSVFLKYGRQLVSLTARLLRGDIGLGDHGIPVALAVALADGIRFQPEFANQFSIVMALLQQIGKRAPRHAGRKNRAV